MNSHNWIKIIVYDLYLKDCCNCLQFLNCKRDISFSVIFTEPNFKVFSHIYLQVLHDICNKLEDCKYKLVVALFWIRKLLSFQVANEIHIDNAHLFLLFCALDWYFPIYNNHSSIQSRMKSVRRWSRRKLIYLFLSPTKNEMFSREIMC